MGMEPRAEGEAVVAQAGAVGFKLVGGTPTLLDQLQRPPFFTQESLSATVRLKTGLLPGWWSMESATK
jgi:hypothetical protein